MLYTLSLTEHDATAVSARGHRLLILRANGDKTSIATPSTFRLSGKTITFTTTRGKATHSVEFHSRTAAVATSKAITLSLGFGLVNIDEGGE
jgi:hypothetical protein